MFVIWYERTDSDDVYGPIIIIEDDKEKLDLLEEVNGGFGYPSKIIIINSPYNVLDALEAYEKPLIVFSAINKVGSNGFSLRVAMLNEDDVRQKCSPFTFCCTHGNDDVENRALKRKADGFISDVNDYSKVCGTCDQVVKFWNATCTNKDLLFGCGALTPGQSLWENNV